MDYISGFTLNPEDLLLDDFNIILVNPRESQSLIDAMTAHQILYNVAMNKAQLMLIEELTNDTLMEF